MEKRTNVTTIFKSNDPEKLIVFHAESLQDQIRFYLNDTQYLVAIESDKGCLIKLDEEIKETEGSEKSKITIIRENLKDFIKVISVSMGIIAVCFIGLLCLCEIINNPLVFLFVMNIVYFIMNIVNVVVLESMETAPCIKSKHSAEHMMVNFLEINKRLPKNIEEVKRCSRFSPECGSRILIKGIAEEFIRSIIAAFFAVITSGIISYFFDNSTVNAIVLLVTYYLVRFVVGKLITKYDKLNFIIRPIKKVLTNIAQCANTTSKVKDRDIMLAYSVAKPWIKVVYPEFYNEDDDIFEEIKS